MQNAERRSDGGLGTESRCHRRRTQIASERHLRTSPTHFRLCRSYCSCAVVGGAVVELGLNCSLSHNHDIYLVGFERMLQRKCAVADLT